MALREHKVGSHQSVIAFLLFLFHGYRLFVPGMSMVIGVMMIPFSLFKKPMSYDSVGGEEYTHVVLFSYVTV